MPILPSASKISADQIREQRDRILASDTFLRSSRLSKFLNYVVDAFLEGRQDKLKEFVLGIDVFDKDDSFDPGIDSIVRVEASRLRGKLRDYYDDVGQSDAVRIEIPKGHYIPTFSLTEAPSVERQGFQMSYAWAAIVIVILAATIAYFAMPTTLQQDVVTAGIAQAAPANSVAILPLRDWSNSPEEFFSEALTDGLITSLANVPSLRVTSLTSVLRYVKTDIPVPEIGRVLNVAYVVEGSVTRSEDNVRVKAQLIDSETDNQVWAESFDRSMSDLMFLQSEIAAEIAAQISDEHSRVSQSRNENVNPAAYEAYMKGRYFYNQFTADGYVRGMELFQKALDIEPDYAAAYAGLASCHCLLAGHGLEMVSPVISIPQAQSHAMKALSLDSELAEPVAFLGIIDFKYGWNPEQAEAKLERAIALNPSLYQAHVWHSQILEAMGRNDEAVNRARSAKQLNPLSLAASLNLGWQLFQAGRLVEATTEIDGLIEFDPGFWGGHWVRGHIYNRHRLFDKAISEFRIAVDLGGGHSLPLSALGYTFAVAGMDDEAQKIIEELNVLAKENYVSPFHVATVYAGLNEPNLMFEQLEKAYQVRARSLAWLQVTNELQPFQEDPRFQNLLDRIGILAYVESIERSQNDI